MKRIDITAPSAAVADETAAPNAAEMPEAAEAPPPANAKVGVTAQSICNRLRVVDAETGEPIEKVVEADADKGLVVRFAVKDGALVRENDRFKLITEDRPIRFEWVDAGQTASF